MQVIQSDQFMKFDKLGLTYFSLAAISSAAVVSIPDNTNVNLSTLLENQPGLKLSEISFQGGFQATTPTARLVVDTSKTFAATAGTMDQQLYAPFPAIGTGLSGEIFVQSGKTLTISGNTGGNDVAMSFSTYQQLGLFKLRAEDSTAGFVIENNSGIYAVGNGLYSNLLIENATFRNNIGGAIRNSGRQDTTQSGYGVLTLVNNSFTGNIHSVPPTQSSQKSGGAAIRNGFGGTVISTGSTFTSNKALPADGELASNKYGGAIYNNGVLNITGGSFTGNEAGGNGGAIHTEFVSGMPAARTILTDVSFTGNKLTAGNGASHSGGGAIYSYAQELTITRAVFTENSNAYTRGGAISASLGATTLTDVSFFRNSAAMAGGAVYSYSPLSVNVTAGKTSTYSGNTANGVANSIHIAIGGLAVNTEAGATLDMRDPFTSATASSTAIVKTGSGTWKLGGANGSTFTGSHTSFDVNEGTLYLYGAGEVANATLSNASAVVGSASITLNGYTSSFQGSPFVPSSFRLGSGATLVAGGVNSINIGFAPHATETGYIRLDNNSTVKGGTGSTELLLYAQRVLLGTSAGDKVNLSADAGDTLLFRASLRGEGGLVKTGAGTVILQGNRQFGGAIDVNEGTLAVQLATTFDVGGINIGAGATLDLSLAAHSMSEDFTVGISGSDAGQILAHANQSFTTSTLTLDFGSADLASFIDGTSWDVLDGSGATFVTVALHSQGVTHSMTYNEGADTWTFYLGADRGLIFSNATGILEVGSLSLIPEPATFAALAGMFSLSLACMRRRKRV